MRWPGHGWRSSGPAHGNLDKALEAAQKAVSLNPNLSRTQTVLGFAHLIRIDTDKARVAFQKAIELDQGDPLPKLGLGMAKIRDGELAERPGRYRGGGQSRPRTIP